MADSFFGFDTTLSAMDEGEGISEDEYDLLNDETFGQAHQGDWERQHETFAKISESNKKSKDDDLDLEACLSNVLDDCVLSSSNDQEDSSVDLDPKVWANPEKPMTQFSQVQMPHNLCTLEEIERGLISRQSTGPPLAVPSVHTVHNNANLVNHLHPPPGIMRHFNQIQTPRYPPGLARPPITSMQQLGAQIRMIPPPHLAHTMQNNMGYGGQFPIGPNFMSQTYPHPSYKHRPMFTQQLTSQQQANQQANQNMVQLIQQNHPMLNRNQQHNRIFNNHNTNHMHGHGHGLHNQSQNNHLLHNGYQNQGIGQNYNNKLNHNHNKSYENNGQFNAHLTNGGEALDEYGNLMSNREKQWLINIQLMQLNTGTPYVDDYYYTVYTERQRKLKGLEETVAHKNNTLNHPLTQPKQQNNRFNFNMGNRGLDGTTRERRNSQSRDKETTQQRTYTPLQFENSLGKLQCGSVTAPRKIIDMDVVSTEKESSYLISGEAKKSRQLLLTIESLYRTLLKLEDLSNPVAISTAKFIKERDEKQQLQQLEQRSKDPDASFPTMVITPTVKPDDKMELINRLLTALDRVGILSIRKGKVLLLRILPHLSIETHKAKLLDFYIRLIKNLPLLGRKDQHTDNLLPRFYPIFKIFLGSSSFLELLALSDSFVEIGEKGIAYCIGNKFGVSVMSAIIYRCEEFHYLEPSNQVTIEAFRHWSIFVLVVGKSLQLVNQSSYQPLEFIDRDVLYRHLGRVKELPSETVTLFERIFVCLEQREN